MKPEIVFSKKILDENETSYAITLKNGSALLVVEDTNRQTISIGLDSGATETHEHVADAWICSMDASGVLVMPNSGMATEDLVHQPTVRK